MKTLCLKALLAAVGLTSVAAALANPYVSAGATGVDADAPMQLLKVGDRIGTPPPILWAPQSPRPRDKRCGIRFSPT
ncbi:hypothetical protein [Paraburkholderia megapolitana]|uniref:hypothetical protein n=1 Tax=Paraburkholderia megapolitana TaxID=420953 RepID=UPI0011856260|nr:hypothetical protein [Paraburkholderia megapolitana]QDQ84072.1 hypothetical protein FNZ07_23395 [Paraburkholderia megapolitana]